MSDYRWAFTEDGDAIECGQCASEVPLQLYERTYLIPSRGWVSQLLCEICSTSRMSSYPNQRERAEEVAIGAANQVLLKLHLSGLGVFPPSTEKMVVRVDEGKDEWVEVEPDAD